MNKNIELTDTKGNVYVVNIDYLNVLLNQGGIRRKVIRRIGQFYRYNGPNREDIIGKLWMVTGNIDDKTVNLVCLDENHPDRGYVFRTSSTKVSDLNNISESEWRSITDRSPESFDDFELIVPVSTVEKDFASLH